MTGLLLAAGQLLLVAQGVGGEVHGEVRNAATGAPIAGAVVELAGPTRRSITDTAGRYQLADVTAGPHLLLVRFIGFESSTLHVLVPSAGEVVVDVALDPRPVPLPTIDVWSGGRDIAARGQAMHFADRTLTTRDIRSPVLLAEPDAFRALGSGDVVLDPEAPSGLNVRGGSSDQVGFTLDGIPVFNPFHAAGLFGGWNPDAISTLQGSFAAPSAGGPDAASALIAGITERPSDRFAARGSASTGQMRVAVDGPLGAGGAGYLLAIRSSFPDAVSPDRDPSYLRGGADDWLATLELPLENGHLHLLGYGNQNHSSTARSLAAPSEGRNLIGWGSLSLGAEWWRTRATTTVRFRGWSAAGDAYADWSALAAPVSLASVRHDLGLQTEVEWAAADGKRATLAGLRVERRVTRYRVSSDSAGGPQLLLDGGTLLATMFAEHQRSIASGLEARLGGSIAGSAAGVAFDPRGQLRWRPRADLAVTGSVARLHQFTQSLRNPESVVGMIFPADLPVIAGRHGIPAVQSDQLDLSLDFRPTRDLRLSASGYRRWFDGLLLVAANEGEPFLTGALATGNGTASGAGIDAEFRLTGITVTASYGVQRIRFRHAGADYVPQHGANQLLATGVAVTPMSGSTVRVGLTGVWGRHATAVSSGFEWEACNLHDQGCEFGGSPHQQGESVGGTTLPAYLRLDLGFRQELHFSAGGRPVSTAVYGTFTNLLGRINLLTQSRDGPSGQQRGIEMRPRAPLVVGMDWQF